MSGEKRSHKLWGGRFSLPTDKALDALNRSIGVDYRLWPGDIRLSDAWAAALGEAGILTREETAEMQRGLAAVKTRLENGAEPDASDEDVHTMIDRMLHDEVGDVASKLHTGRSRNDQVATATRLWTMDLCQRLDHAVRVLKGVLLEQAESLQTALMPSYTHM